MTRYALPAPTGPEPEPAPALWLGSCPRCSGEGVVVLDVAGADADDRYTCAECGGSGVASAETVARRLREAD